MIGTGRVLGLVAAGLLAATWMGCLGGFGGTAEPPPATFAQAPAQGEYVIGTADVLRISVWKNPELSVDVPVRPDGKISVPLADDVRAQGLTATELKELLTAAFTEFVAAPDVTVLVIGVNSKRAYVIGAVGRPGPVNLEVDLRVLDALSAAGGFTTFAQKDEIKVIRNEAGGDFEFVFDYDAYVTGKAPGSNIWLKPGDTVVVPE